MSDSRQLNNDALIIPSTNPTSPPKTQIPRQGRMICHRKRLLDKLSDVLKNSHLWITGPPGAGKTVLASDYAEQSSCSVAWYEFDVLDADLPSFFETFPMAFSSPSAPIQSLPKLLPDDMLGLPVFARKFYRRLFSQLREEWLLILDNCQDIPADSPLTGLLALCLKEIPDNCRVIFLSRCPPPNTFAHIKTSGFLHQSNVNMLRFTPEEIGQVLTLHGMTREQENCIQYLSRTTAGWAAGITLLLQDQNRENCPHETIKGLPYQELFDYFAGVIFSDLSENEKSILLPASLLPEIRPEVIDSLGEWGPCRTYFTELSRKNFFTNTLNREETLFKFHPLFKAFLRRKAEETLPAASLKEIQEQAAELLLHEGRSADAVTLLNQAESWQKSACLIKEIGTEMLIHGRFKTLLRWQQALPDDTIKNDPWLLFYFGSATTAFFPSNAIEILKQSFVLFQKQDNASGAIRACSALTNSICNHLSDLSALDPWLDYFDQHLDPASFPYDKQFEHVAIANAVFRAMVLRRPSHPDLESWTKHVIRQGGMHPALITHYLWTGQFAEARAALDNIYANQEGVGSKLQLSAIKAMEVQYYLIMGESDKCIQVIDESQQLIEETGIQVWEVHFLILGAGCCLNCGEQKKANRYLKAVEKKIDKARKLELSYYHAVKMLAALLADDLVKADRHQQSALDMAIQVGMPSYSTWCWYGSALVAIFQNNRKKTTARMDKVFQLAASSGNPWFTCQAHLALAYFHLQNNEREDAVRQLQQGFALARHHNYLTFFFFIPKMMCALAVTALEENIETNFVCRFIRRWQLTPAAPPVHLVNWPWPVRIYTLGRFSVLCNDTPFASSSTARNKPIRLLLALLSFGGRQVNKIHLADLLWPDSDGDAQAAALKINLHRLRQLLGGKNVIIQETEHLSINPQFCWVDNWQFERMANEFIALDDNQRKRHDVLKDKTQALYNGEFLSTYQEYSWILNHQQHLQELFLKVQSKAEVSPAV